MASSVPAERIHRRAQQEVRRARLLRFGAQVAAQARTAARARARGSRGPDRRPRTRQRGAACRRGRDRAEMKIWRREMRVKRDRDQYSVSLKKAHAVTILTIQRQPRHIHQRPPPMIDAAVVAPHPRGLRQDPFSPSDSSDHRLRSRFRSWPSTTTYSRTTTLFIRTRASWRAGPPSHWRI